MSGVTFDQWPTRLSLAVGQLARGTLDYPRSQASWTSVARRSLVVGGFTAYALVTNSLDTAVFAAFGALQIGLSETAMPLRRLLRLLLLSIIAIVVVAGTGLWLSGTWWTVPLLTVVAFLQGATASGGVIPRTVGIGALALGVIFAGLDADPLTATVWLAIGLVTQSVFALILWHRERALAVRQSIRNALFKVIEIVQATGVSGIDNNAASAQLDETVELITDSGVGNRDAALRVTAQVGEVRRNVVAWRELRHPGLAERLRISRSLRRCEILLSEAPNPARPRSQPGIPFEPEWPVTRRLDRAIAELDDAIAHLDDQDGQPTAGPSTPNWSARAAITPGTQEFRHGLRMAVAILVAQTLSLLVPLTHAFWIPLTCVFVVKPDWAFTLTRSIARVGGNFLAVLLVPALLFIVGADTAAVAVVVFLVSAVAFRFFTGNYILGSFGIAGTILILDQLLNYNPELYASRVISTLIGAAVGISVAALIPSWRSNEAVQLLHEVVSGLAQLSRQTTQGLLDPASLDEESMNAANEQERKNLIRLRPAAEAAMLEPHPVVDPRCLSVAVDAAGRAHLTLMSLGVQARMLKHAGRPGLDISAPAQKANECFEQACDELGLPAPVPPPAGFAEQAPHPPESVEDAAVFTESVRLAQSAVDFAQAVSWIAATPTSRTGAG